jgi:hypothetical protein
MGLACGKQDRNGKEAPVIRYPVLFFWIPHILQAIPGPSGFIARPGLVLPGQPSEIQKYP